MFCPKCGASITPNDKFCPKCGNAISNIPNNTNFSKTKNGTLKKSLITISSALIIIAILAIFILKSNNIFYFANTTGSQIVQSQDNSIIDDNLVSNTASTVNSTKSNTSANKYKTMVVWDNVYHNQTIHSEEDAKKLIEEDSTNQKDSSYPKEIQDVENQFISQYGITACNLREMDPSFAKELLNVFKKIYDEYPMAKGSITNVTLTNTTIDETYIAAFLFAFPFAYSGAGNSYPVAIKTQIFLSAQYFLNEPRLEKSVSQGSSKGWFPPNSDKFSPLAHELGHYLSFLGALKEHKMDSVLLIDDNNESQFYNLSIDQSNNKYDKELVDRAYKKYQSDTGDTIGFDDFRGTISGYALAKDNDGKYLYCETVAESFHDTYLNGDNAKTASKYIIAELKSDLGA